ncbi:MAG TPA: hypothetical protein VEO54_16385 [Thermoanaerobaculia bacterium]|nr:hypothetical protein [Thermoanaerobaculia bacterium]
MAKSILCVSRSLPPEKLATAARRAIEINPANAVESRRVERTPIGRRGGPRRLALVVGRRWPTSGVKLSVQFLDSPPAALRARILRHLNAWSKTANVTFTETRGTGKVRISRFDEPPDMAGYWSYLGTEILEIDSDQPTMNRKRIPRELQPGDITVARGAGTYDLWMCFLPAGFICHKHEHDRARAVEKLSQVSR